MLKERKRPEPKVLKDAKGNEILIKHLHPIVIKRDKMVRKVIAKAQSLSVIVRAYNQEIFRMVNEYLEDTASEYHTNWDGNANLLTFDESQIVEVDIQKQYSYDERLQIAGQKINEMITSMSKDESLNAKQKRNLEVVSQIAKTALSIDSNKSPDRRKIVQLKKFNFDGEPLWAEALELISQSEKLTGTKQYIRFKIKDDKGAVVSIPVNFSDF